MRTINCQIPLKLRFLGEPGEDQWAALEEALTAQYARALRRSLDRMLASGHLEHGLVREPFDPSRLRPDGYLIPSFDDQGQDAPVPVADPDADFEPIIKKIRDLAPETGGLPSDGTTHGVYERRDPASLPRLYYLDEKGDLISFSITVPAPKGDQLVTFSEGDYFVDARPHAEGQITRANRLVIRIFNHSDDDVRILFRVPPGLGAKAPKEDFRFYPHLVIKLKCNEDMTTGMEAVYLASVMIWRLNDDGSSTKIDWLWLGYSDLYFKWELWKVDAPPPGQKGEEKRTKILDTSGDDDILRFIWKDEGTYEVRCWAWLRRKDATDEASYDVRSDTVTKLETKQALELAYAIKEEKAKPPDQRVWSSSAADLFDRYDKALAAETNDARKRAIGDTRDKIRKLLDGVTSAGPFPIPGLFTERRSGETRPLALFIGPYEPDDPDDPQNWKLIDVTYPSFYGTYTGGASTAQGAIDAAFHDAIDRFHNVYPPGQIRVRLEFPGMEKWGLQGQDYTVATESWKREAWEWFTLGAQVLGTLALAASFVFPPSAFVTGLVIVSVSAGAAVSASNIVDRINKNTFEWDASAVSDLVNIAASLTLIGGAVTRGLAAGTLRALAEGESVTIEALSRLATLKRIQTGFMLFGLGGDLTNGILIAAETYREIRDVDAQMDPNLLRDYIKLYGEEEGNRRWQLERETRIMGILARAAVNGTLTAISVRSTTHAIAEGRSRLGSGAPPEGGPPSGTEETGTRSGTGEPGAGVPAATLPAPPVEPGATATNQADYLNQLRADVQTQPAGSAGRRWDYDRFPNRTAGQDWQPGDPINMPTRDGYPTYDTARGRYWKNRAYFETQARARGEVAREPNSSDPIRRLPDNDLQGILGTGNAPPAVGGRPGQVMELEHSGVPQRVNDWLAALGYSNEEARRISRVSDPGALLEVNPVEHAFFDAIAALDRWGGARRDVAGRKFATTAAYDVRVNRPLAAMDDATIQWIVQDARARGFNFNRNNQTRQLRDGLRAEINLRNLPITPP